MVYAPGLFPVHTLPGLEGASESYNGKNSLVGMSRGYHVSDYYLDLSRHHFYGKHKRTEFALGLSLHMNFTDRYVATAYSENYREETISGPPNSVHLKTKETWQVAVFDRYNAIGIGPKAVARWHINQRLSVNSALFADVGYPFNSELLAVYTTFTRKEFTSNEETTVTESKDLNSVIQDKPGQWHLSVTGKTGLSFRIVESDHFFVELGMAYGVRQFFAWNTDNPEWFYAPSIGFRAYL